jgi:hypothetical protein
MKVINKTSFKKTTILKIMSLAQVPVAHDCKSLTIKIDAGLEIAGAFINHDNGHYEIILRRASLCTLSHELKHLAQCERLGSINFDRLYNAQKCYDSNIYEIQARSFERMIKSIRSSLI